MRYFYLFLSMLFLMACPKAELVTHDAMIEDNIATEEIMGLEPEVEVIESPESEGRENSTNNILDSRPPVNRTTLDYSTLTDVGYISFKNYEEQLENLIFGGVALSTIIDNPLIFNPVIYFGFEHHWGVDGNLEFAFPPDIYSGYSRSELPISPGEIILYHDNFIELQHYAGLNDRAMADLWLEILEEKGTTLYQFEGDFLGQVSRLELVFKGNRLSRIMIHSEEQTVINRGEETIPYTHEIVLMENSLEDVWQSDTFSGTLMMEMEPNSYGALAGTLNVYYQQAILWYDFPLTLQYYTRLNLDEDVFSGRITQMKLFNLEDDTESKMFMLFQNRYVPTEEQEVWLWERLASDDWYNQSQPEPLDGVDYREKGLQRWIMEYNYYFLSDEVILYASGFSGMYDHITLIQKEDFHFPNYLFQ